MFDVDGITELVADLSDAPGRAQRKVDGVVRKGAVNVRDDWRDLAASYDHAPLYPLSITFDTKWEGSAYVAEVGPDKDKPQGALGNLIEYGSANNPPHADGAAALSVEEPRFEQAMTELADL